MSPHRATQGDPVQNIRLKTKEGQIKQIALWGKPAVQQKNEVMKVSNLNVTKDGGYSSTRHTEIDDVSKLVIII